MGLMIFFIVASILMIVGTVLYLKYTSPQSKNKRRASKYVSESEEEVVLTKKEISEIKKIWEIEDIRNGVIKLTKSRYRCIVRLGSIDMGLLSEDEQEITENRLMQAAKTFNFPVLYFTTTERVETDRAIEDIALTMEDETLPEQLRGYCYKLSSHLNSIMEDRGVYVRKSYATVFVDDMLEEEKAIRELYRRTNLFINSFNRAKLPCDFLNTAQIIDLLHREIKKESPIKPSLIINLGGMDLYMTGVGINCEIDLDEVAAAGGK